MDGLLPCSLGGHTAPVAAFGVNRASPTGYNYSCKSCLRTRKRELHPTTPRPVRQRTVIDGIPHTWCHGWKPGTGHFCPSSAFPKRRTKRGPRTGAEGALCPRCGTKRRTLAHQKKLVAELTAPPGTPTPLLDALARAERKKDRRRTADYRTRRAEMRDLVRVFARRLIDRGDTRLRLAALAGIHPETLRRWLDEGDKRMPNGKPLERALAAFKRALFATEAP